MRLLYFCGNQIKKKEEERERREEKSSSIFSKSSSSLLPFLHMAQVSKKSFGFSPTGSPPSFVKRLAYLCFSFDWFTSTSTSLPPLPPLPKYALLDCGLPSATIPCFMSDLWCESDLLHQVTILGICDRIDRMELPDGGSLEIKYTPPPPPKLTRHPPKSLSVVIPVSKRPAIRAPVPVETKTLVHKRTLLQTLKETPNGHTTTTSVEEEEDGEEDGDEDEEQSEGHVTEGEPTKKKRKRAPKPEPFLKPSDVWELLQGQFFYDSSHGVITIWKVVDITKSGKQVVCSLVGDPCYNIDGSDIWLRDPAEINFRTLNKPVLGTLPLSEETLPLPIELPTKEQFESATTNEDLLSYCVLKTPNNTQDPFKKYVKGELRPKLKKKDKQRGNSLWIDLNPTVVVKAKCLS